MHMPLSTFVCSLMESVIQIVLYNGYPKYIHVAVKLSKMWKWKSETDVRCVVVVSTQVTQITCKMFEWHVTFSNE